MQLFQNELFIKQNIKLYKFNFNNNIYITIIYASFLIIIL